MIQENEDVLPRVTVAVCTRDRVQHLTGCLAAIERLTYPRLDILLVDNAPETDAAERLVTKEFPDVRYVTEPRPGLDWSRNRAIMEAKGEIIVFTDDDVVVEPEWIQAIVKVFVENVHVMAVTGLVLPYELETETQVLFEMYGGFGKGLERREFPPHEGHGCCKWAHLAAGDLGTGANMAFRRPLFDAIGGFDPALDVGTATCGGGDLEMFFRVIQEGYTLIYEPAAVVRHIHRREYRELKTQIRSWGTAFIAYLMKSARAYPKERLRIYCFTLRWVIGRHLIRAITQLLGPRRIPLNLMLMELWGSMNGFFAYRTASIRADDIRSNFGPIGASFPVPGAPIENADEK